MSRRTLALLFVVVALIVCGGFSLLVARLLFLNVNRVPTGAMANTILPGDQVVSFKLFGDVKRGSVVFFQYPGDQDRYISRVVGLPDETIQVSGHQVLINGQPLEEERVFVKSQHPEFEALEEIKSEGNGSYRVYYMHREGEEGFSEDTAPEDTFGINAPFKIPSGCYFILGDNRDNSYDSRYKGCVPRQLIWGTTDYIYWSQPMNSDDVRWERVIKRIQ